MNICATNGNPRSKCCRRTRSRSVRAIVSGKSEGYDEKQRASLRPQTCLAPRKMSSSAILSNKRTWAAVSEVRKREDSEVSVLWDEIPLVQDQAMVERAVVCKKGSYLNSA
jgi:hypothetical protein